MSPRYTEIPNYYPQQPYFLPRNTQPYQYKSPPEPEQQIYEQDDDSCSQDTYEIEFNNEYETIEEKNESEQERDLSEYNPKRKKEIKLTEFRSKNNVNPVCHKNYTESAGPLQFKRIVNRYIGNKAKSREK